MAIRCISYSISILNMKAKFLNEKLFSFIIIYSAFWDYFASIPCWFIIFVFCILELCYLDSMLLILHSGIMLPRFHAPCFVYAFYILHFAFWNSPCSFTLLTFCILEYVASISSPLFALFI